MCQVLGVTKSGYYAWKREKSQQKIRKEILTAKVMRTHLESRGIYMSAQKLQRC